MTISNLGVLVTSLRVGTGRNEMQSNAIITVCPWCIACCVAVARNGKAQRQYALHNLYNHKYAKLSLASVHVHLPSVRFLPIATDIVETNGS